MGRLSNGLNGPFTGTVGTVVGSFWKGIPYIKSRYKKRTTRITKEEAGNQIVCIWERWSSEPAGKIMFVLWIS